MNANVLKFDDVGFVLIDNVWHVGLFFGRTFKVARPARSGDYHPYKKSKRIGVRVNVKIIMRS